MMSDNTLSPLYAGGIPLESLVEALGSSSTGQRVSTQSRFWSTPSRPASSEVQEVFEVSFSKPQRINYLDFLLARFPQRTYAQWYDYDAQQWRDCTRKGNRSYTEAVRITDSVPSIISAAAAAYAPHPQHYGAGHWQSHTLKISPITTSKIRLVLTRGVGTAPVDPIGTAIPYSLGVKDFNCGYQVLDREDIPLLPVKDAEPTETAPFAHGNDLLGSSIEYAVRRTEAENLLVGGTWKCEPQPISNAVVSLYVDARDSLGQPQVIDRFRLDPLKSGPSLNLYYAKEPPQGEFEAGQVPLQGTAQNTSATPVYPTSNGLALVAGSGIFVGNQIPRLDTNESFSIYLSTQMLFSSDDAAWSTHDGSQYGLLLAQQFFLDWYTDPADNSRRGFFLSAASEGVPESGGQFIPLTFAEGDIINIVLRGDGDRVYCTIGDITVSVALTHNDIPYFMFGTNQIVSSQDFCILRAMSVRADSGSESLTSQFVESPSDFVTGSEYPQDDTGSTTNALLRYHPMYVRSGNSLGFIGGQGARHSNAVWTPVNREYSLRQGYIEFDPVLASAFKFEFTDLLPEPYEVAAPTRRRVNVFPADIAAPTPKAFQVEQSGHDGGSGIATMQSIASLADYQDTYRTSYNLRSRQPQSPYTPTEVVFSSDPTIASRMRGLGGYFNFTSWLAGKRKRFVKEQAHVYETVEVPFEQRVGFFVGLRSIQMMRVDYTSNDDTDRYVEGFDDARNLESSDWEVSGSRIWTPDAGSEYGKTWQAESRTFPAFRRVTGVQFATLESNPVQILPDPAFSDSDAHYAAYGDASVSIAQNFDSDLGDVIRVRRSGLSNVWDGLEFRFDSWDSIEDSIAGAVRPTWDDMETDPDGGDVGGIDITDDILPMQGERVSIAARVYTPETLTSPLTIQVFNVETGDILAAASASPGAGDVTEWYASFVGGEASTVDGRTWDEIVGAGITWDTLTGTESGLVHWDDLTFESTQNVGEVRVRIIQRGFSNDVFYVDNVSAFAESIKWEFSNDDGATYYPVYDIRNNPRGIFMFPDPTPESGGFRWKVTGYRPGVSVSGIVIRPVYDSLPMGLPYRESIQARGPMDSAYDHMPPITADPWFRLWDKPVPQYWWLNQRKWIGQQSLVSA